MIKPTFLTATVGYGATVIGLGMLGMLAAMAGVQPIGGEHNNLIPQMASTYLSPFMIGVFFIMVIGSLSSTADSDLSALSAIVMTDVYGNNLARGRVNPKTMLWIGRLTMIAATMAGVIFASFRMDILGMLVFVGALWGAVVFPVIASFYWDRVTARAFTSAVLTAVVLFTVARFELVPLSGTFGGFFELTATIGAGVVIGLMAFGFFGKRVGIAAGVAAVVLLAPFSFGFLRDYTVLLASLTAYGVSTAVCVGLSLLANERFDFAVIRERVTAFQAEDSAPRTPARRPAMQPIGAD
jgi:Na+/proline symporter